MQLRGYLFLALIAVCHSASAICIDVPLEEHIAKARSVFVATITGASLSPAFEQLQDRQPYTVKYTFEVAVRFKGDPSIVTALTTGGRFDSPSDDVFWTLAEQSRYAPGDSILVVADGPGDVPVSSIGCTASRPWSDNTAQIINSIPWLAP